MRFIHIQINEGEDFLGFSLSEDYENSLDWSDLDKAERERVLKNLANCYKFFNDHINDEILPKLDEQPTNNMR